MSAASTSRIVELYDAARASLAQSGPTADAQTKIALFLGAAKGVNAAMLAPGALATSTTIAYPFVHGQWFREIEFATLLARVTRWSPNPLVYAEGATLVAPLWQEWWRIQLDGAAFLEPRAAYAALAFGHALLARVRLAPVLADDCNALDPFVVAIRRMEQESGRMIQTQMRLLKDVNVPLALAEREQIVEDEQAIVDATFARFLQWLSGDADAAAQPAAPRAAPTTEIAGDLSGANDSRERQTAMPRASPAVVVPGNEHTLQ